MSLTAGPPPIDGDSQVVQNSGPFRAGDRAQLTGPKGRLNTITLEPSKVFHTHRGIVAHDDIIGLPDGSVVTNNVGVEHLVLRPLLVDFVMSMPRGAALNYPTAAAKILAQADIFPGATVPVTIDGPRTHIFESTGEGARIPCTLSADCHETQECTA